MSWMRPTRLRRGSRRLSPRARAPSPGPVRKGETGSTSKDGSPRGPEKHTQVLGEREARQVGELGRHLGHGIAGSPVRRRHDAGADRLEREPRPAGDAGPPVRFVGAPADPAQSSRPDPPPGFGGTVALAAPGEIRPQRTPAKRSDENREQKIARAFPHPER